MFEFLLGLRTNEERVFEFALFAGQNQVLPLESISKYSYLTDTITPSGSLSVARQGLTASGNKSVGVFIFGNTATSYLGSTPVGNIDRYAYSSGVVSSSSVIGNNRGHSGAAAGNSSYGVHAIGWWSGFKATAVRYTYATDTHILNIQLNMERDRLAATGNNSMGLFAGGVFSGGQKTPVVMKHLYANSSSVTTTYLPSAKSELVAAGNKEIALFVNGDSSTKTTYSYKYSNASMTTGALLTVAGYGQQATSNPSYALFTGGWSSGQTNLTEKHLFASSTVVQGTKLPGRLVSGAATSGNPGWL